MQTTTHMHSTVSALSRPWEQLSDECPANTSRLRTWTLANQAVLVAAAVTSS